MNPSSEIRELYRGAPEGFIAARDSLAKRLRDDGRDQDATAVKKLRRPTVAAWALDRLADVAPDEVGALLDAGAALARAQRATLSGRDPQALREATTRRRELVAELSEKAAEALRDAGGSPDPHLEDIRGTLEAASVDEEIGERLRVGTLERTSRPAAGFGDIAGLQLVSRHDDALEATSKAPSKATARGKASPATDEAERARELEAEIRRLRRDRDATQRRSAAAEDARARMAEQVTSMESRLDAARGKLREAESSASELRMSAKRAAKAFEAAERKRKGSG
jgi:hypothetical protein